MHWVIQNNIFAEEGFERLVTALDRLGLARTLVKVVPFVGDLELVEGELPAPGTKAIVMGSYTLAHVARQRGWRPGAFLDNLDYEEQRRHWGDHMLNGDASICRFGEVPEQRAPFFLRPVHDTKAFTGAVTDYPEYMEWRDKLRRLAETGDQETESLAGNLLTLETPVMVCPRKDIWSETRTWIVDGRLATCSGYKVGSIKRYTEPHEVDERIKDYAVARAAQWSPNRAYVMDIAETPDGLKIIEVNNLNSAGWYKGDVQQLIEALEAMPG